MKITPPEKRRHVPLPAACRLFSREVIFTRARVSLALLSLRKNEGLLVVYCTPYNGLYGESPPEMGTFLEIQLFQSVGNSQGKVYERAGKSTIKVIKRSVNGNVSRSAPQSVII